MSTSETLYHCYGPWNLQICRLVNGLKGQHTDLKEARFLFYGAGSSAVGVAQLLALLLEKQGGQSTEAAWKVRPILK